MLFTKYYKEKNSYGFTVIEILVVMAIVALVASGALYMLNTARIKARDSKRKADMAIMRKALDLYYGQNGVYPATAGCTGANGADIQTIAVYLTPTFASALPNDPKFTSAGYPNNYAYGCTASGNGYNLYIPFGNDGTLASCKLQGPNPPSAFSSIPVCTYQ